MKEGNIRLVWFSSSQLHPSCSTATQPAQNYSQSCPFSSHWCSCPQLSSQWEAEHWSLSWHFLTRCLLCIPNPEAGSRPGLAPSLKPFLSVIPKPSALGQLPYTCFSQVDRSFSSWLDPPSNRSHLSCSVTPWNLLWPSEWYPARFFRAKMNFHISLTISRTIPMGEIINHIGLKLEY